MVIMDLDKKVLGAGITTRRRRLAVLRYLLRGYTAPEAWEELSRLSWWEGWTINTVRADMRALRQGIKDYGQALPEVREAISWALGYYTDTIKEYDRLIKKFEGQGRDDLAIRYRNMRDRLAERAFSALGVNNLSLNLSAGGPSGSWEAVKTFFGIEDSPPESPTKSKKPRTSKPKKKRTKGGKQRKKSV